MGCKTTCNKIFYSAHKNKTYKTSTKVKIVSLLTEKSLERWFRILPFPVKVWYSVLKNHPIHLHVSNLK